MKKSTKKHLEEITIEALVEFKESNFSYMASFSGRNGIVQIGSIGGKYAVRTKLGIEEFETPKGAIGRYEEFLIEYSY